MGLACALAALCTLGLAAAGPAAAQDPPACLYPGADAFAGDSLDLENRWTSTLRHDDALYDIADGTARVQTGPYEIQEDQAGNAAPNIFLQPAPAGTWEVTTTVNIAQTHEGHQAGLLVSDPTGNDIVKLTYVQKSDDVDGQSGNKWIEFLKFVDGDPDFTGTWHSPESRDYPDELMLRFRSDGDTLSGWYSVDGGETWLSAGDPRNYEAIEDPQVGFYALRGAPSDPVVTAEFDAFNLVPANDEFDGTAIDECRWTEIRNRNDAGMSVGGGELTLRTLQGELSNDQSGVQNLLLQETNDSNWQATTKLTMSPTADGQQAGLVIWGDNSDPAAANYVKLVFVRKNANPTNNAWIEFLKTTDGATDFGDGNPYWNSGLGEYGPTVYLRLVSTGGRLSAFWSDDGEVFTKVGVTHTIEGIENPQVGLMALKGNDANKPEVDARFDWFHIEPAEAEPPPEAPDCLTQSEPETGFESIFDGTQASFDEWEHAGQGFFTLDAEAGSMTSGNTAEQPNYGLHWYTGEQYRNFSVRMQWRTSDATDNSGVFVRFPDPGDDPNVAVNRGHEIQINENPGGDPQKTGSIYNADRENFRNARPAGEWNDYEITVVGQRYTVCLNGKVVNEYVSNQGREAVGYIGVQNHDPASNVSFRDIRVKELSDVPPAQNIFDTIGITQIDTRQNGQIYGQPLRYSFIGEQMPPSGSVGIPGDDEHDDVPLRMPNTRGTEPNLAAFNGQEYFFADAQRKAYSTLHLFGTATDNGGTPTGGDFLLTFADGTTQTATVRFRDWAQPGNTADDHPVIVTNPRYTTSGTQGNINFYIYHRVVQISEQNRGKVLTSIKLPANATPGGTNAEAYLMALTLEDATGGFEMPRLAANAQFPNDDTPPATTATVDPAQPDGDNGWYTQPVDVALAAADEAGGSQLDFIQYRIDGGTWLTYTGPVTVDTEGAHQVQYRAIDRAGNLEAQKAVAVNLDSQAPEVEVAVSPELAGDSGWYDRAARVMIDPFDGYGSGVAATEYAVNGGAWQAYTGALDLGQDGTYAIAYRATDRAGNMSAAGQPVTVRVDRTAPVTSALLNDAAPVGAYAGAVRLELGAVDAGSGAVATEFRVDGGAWTPYAGAFTVAGDGVHRVEFRSVDAAGNPEPTRQVAFTIGVGSAPPPPLDGGQAAPDPEPWVGLSAVARSRSTVSAFRRGRLRVAISCQSVERGTLRLTVSRRVARRLGLDSRTLARARVRCDGAATTVALKPGRAVWRALAGRKGGTIRATLSVRLTGADGTVSDSARLSLRR